MFGALTLIPVRQQHHQARHLSPLVLGRHQEVVDDYLGTVDEVAELGLPHRQRRGDLDRVAVLEAEDGIFAQEGVTDGEARRIGVEMGQRDPLLTIGVVDKDCMTLTERASPSVLTRESDIRPLNQE